LQQTSSVRFDVDKRVFLHEKAIFVFCVKNASFGGIYEPQVRRQVFSLFDRYAISRISMAKGLLLARKKLNDSRDLRSNPKNSFHRRVWHPSSWSTPKKLAIRHE
jgi:hypothetical protein